MHVDPNTPRTTLTKRQLEVLDRLEHGQRVKKIAADIGISRAAVYQHIERLRRQGALAETYTPSGQPPRRADAGVLRGGSAGVAPRDSAVAALRRMAAAGAAGGPDYAETIGTAIASADAVGLAYELGRLDALGEQGLPRDLVEAALRRLSVLPSDDGDEK